MSSSICGSKRKLIGWDTKHKMSSSIWGSQRKLIDWEYQTQSENHCINGSIGKKKWWIIDGMLDIKLVEIIRSRNYGWVLNGCVIKLNNGWINYIMNIQLIDRWIKLMIFAWEDELMDGMIEWWMNEPHSNISKY